MTLSRTEDWSGPCFLLQFLGCMGVLSDEDSCRPVLMILQELQLLLTTEPMLQSQLIHYFLPDHFLHGPNFPVRFLLRRCLIIPGLASTVNFRVIVCQQLLGAVDEIVKVCQFSIFKKVFCDQLVMSAIRTGRCHDTTRSYVGYLIKFGPVLFPSLSCCLALLCHLR